MMYKQLLKLIKDSNKIVIYRHERPDGDAVFSQFALYSFLKENFKDKEIQMYSKKPFDILPYRNIVDNAFIKDSLAIIIDTANSSRCESLSYKLAKHTVKIDHHPPMDNFAELNIIDDKTVATSEVLADILLSKEFSKYSIPNETYMYLFCGILSDSNGFRTSSTTTKSLSIASKLALNGNLDIAALGNYIFNKTINDFKKDTKVRNLLIVKKGVGYIVANQKCLDKLKMTKDDIKNDVDMFNSIKGLKIWAIFAYNKKTYLYDASVRSQKKYIINTLCSKYNGGGHRNACGIKDLTLKEVREIINKLVEIAEA